MKHLNFTLFLLSVGYLVIDAFCYKEFFKASATIWLLINPPAIPFAQKIAYMISWFGNEILIVLLIGLCAADTRRVRSMKVLCVSSIYGAIFIGIKKMLFAYPRPWWVFSEIKHMGCDRDYGRPSGHSEYTVFTYMLIYRELFIRPRREHQPQPEGASRRGTRYFFRNLFILICFLVPASRFILGVHSLDQVTGGVCWAYVSFSLYTRFLEDYFDKLFRAAIGGEWMKHWKYYLTITVLANLITSYLPLIAYKFMIKFTAEQEQYWKLIFIARCQNDKHYEGPLEMSLYRSTPISIMFGIIYSLMFLPQKFQQQFLDMNLSLKMKIARVIVMAVIVEFGSFYVGKMLTFESDLIYYRYWLHEIVRLVIVGIFIAAICPICFYYLKLVGIKIEKEVS